ncbi:Protein O-glucosyltransferase 1 [Porphyridium purpureum]|uniref:Protein O-glucosyltransferase 1 n=1 Tax=Porphyridium purpureum TaxID=35688 RepID=A0A5J4YXE3_PORPP|nr:Protein O-glucosyltransferase 1 [Porphyridium purpureum]|eukprot:POR5166..scf209_3
MGKLGLSHTRTKAERREKTERDSLRLVQSASSSAGSASERHDVQDDDDARGSRDGASGSGSDAERSAGRRSRRRNGARYAGGAFELKKEKRLAPESKMGGASRSSAASSTGAVRPRDSSKRSKSKKSRKSAERDVDMDDALEAGYAYSNGSARTSSKGGVLSRLRRMASALIPRTWKGWAMWLLVSIIFFTWFDVQSRTEEVIPMHLEQSLGDAAVILTSSELRTGHDATLNARNAEQNLAELVGDASHRRVEHASGGGVQRVSVAEGNLDSASARAAENAHPMDRGVERLMVPGGTGVLKKEQIKDHYRRLVLAYLTPFKSGIPRSAFFTILNRKSYKLTPDGANKGAQSILFQIVDQKVYMFDPYEVPKSSKDFYRARVNEMVWILSKLAKERRIRDTEFLVAIHDCVQTASKRHNYRVAKFLESNPVFTIVACNFSDNIPFPMWEGDVARGGGYSGWDSRMEKFGQDYIPWQEKAPRAVFRGGNRASAYFPEKDLADLHCSEIGRARLRYLSQIRAEIFDVSLSGRCGGSSYQMRRLTPEEHHRYKYVVYAEGNCFWADRMNRQLFGPSAIIKQETPCGQFYEPLMKPFVHYIPSDFFFGDLVERVDWCLANDDVVRGIVKNANEFARNFLSLNGIELYIETLMEEYTNLLVSQQIKLEPGAVDVTDKRF